MTRWPMTRWLFFPAVLLTIALALELFAGGCTPSAMQASPQAAAQIRKIADAAAVGRAVAATQSARALQKAKDNAAVARIQGRTDPLHHPVAAANNFVVDVRPWLVLITALAFLGWAIAVGLSFTPFGGAGFLSALRPVFRWVWVLGLAAIFALPLLPLGALILLAAAAGLLVYELVKDRGNVPQAIRDAEIIVGLKSQLPVASCQLPATPASAPAPAPATPAPQVTAVIGTTHVIGTTPPPP